MYEQICGAIVVEHLAEQKEFSPGTQIAAGLFLFQGIDAQLLAEIGPALRLQVYGAGDRLFGQADEPDDLIIVLNGHVRISARDRAIPSDDTFIVSRGPGDVIGEQAFIENTRRTAAATAQDTVRVLLVQRPAVERLLNDAAFLRNLLSVVSRKLSEATDARAFRYRNEALLFGEFRAHVSPEVEQELLRRGGDYGKPRRQNVVVMFSDIRNFTGTSAIVEPLALARELSTYLDHVVQVIHKHGGMVDKFIGDAVMAFWGDTLPENTDAAERALACAWEMVETAGKYSFGSTPIAIGIGLEAGEVFVGNVGGEGKRQFTVLGSAVNLASRYEVQTKGLRVPIVIGSALYTQLPESWREKLVAYVRDIYVRDIKGAGFRTLYGFGPPAA